MEDVQIKFDALDEIEEKELAALFDELKDAGAAGEVSETGDPQGALAVASIVALVSVSTASAAALSSVSAFLYRTFRRGILVNLKFSPPRIQKHADLPRGSLLIIYSDGREELHQGVSSEKIGELVSQAIALSK